MRREIVLAILLLGTGLAQLPPSAEAQGSAGPSWWDTDYPFRVLVEGSGSASVPEVGRAQSDLLGHEISFQEALESAGWPNSLKNRPDPSTLVVVPYGSFGSGAPVMSPGPLPVRVVDPTQQTGACDTNTTSRCLLLWERVPGATGYGIYWAPVGWEVEVPETGPAPTIMGHTMGHETLFFLNGFNRAPLRVLVHPVDGTDVLVQSIGAEGVTTVYGPGNTATCDVNANVLTCPVGAGTVRVLANEPVTAVVHEDGATLDPASLVAVDTAGPTGASLRTVLPGGSYSSLPEVVVWAHEGSCIQPCSVTIQPGGQTRSVSGSFPVSQRLPVDDEPQAVRIEGPGDARLHAAIRGIGFTELAARDLDPHSTIVPVDGQATLVTSRSTEVDLNDMSRGAIIRENLEVEPHLRTLALSPETKTLEVVADDPVRVFAGGSDDTALPLHQPLTIDGPVPVPDGARLVAVSPGVGRATQSATVEHLEGREPVTGLVRLSAGGSREVVRSGDGPSVVSFSGRALMGLVVAAPPPSTDAPPLVGQGLTVRHPVLLERTSVAYVAKAMDVSVEPQSVFAGAGGLVHFNVTLQNLARSPSGDTPPMTVELGLNPVGRAANLSIEATLGTTAIQLPGNAEDVRRVPLNLRVPEGVADLVLEVQVRATVADDPRIEGVATARVSVVTIRDFELTFDDGSTRQVQTAQPGGTNDFGLTVRNTGTVPLDIRLSTQRLGGEGFQACLRAEGGSSCNEELVLSGVEPGARARAVLQVTSPDKDEEDRVDLLVRGELAQGAGPVRSVDATVFLNVPVVASLSTDRGSLAMAPGSTQLVNVTVENQGVQATGKLHTAQLTGAVNASLLDPESGQPTQDLQQLLGPRDTGAATWTSKLRVSVSPEAPPGLTTEVRIELTLQPTGGLPPFRTSTTLPVRVLRVLDHEPLDVQTLRAGTPTQLELPLRVPSLTGSEVDIRLTGAPATWDLDTPTNLSFDQNGRGVLSLGIHPPPATPPGTHNIVLTVLDPLGPGGDLQLEVRVLEGGNANLTLPSEAAVALGDHLVMEARIQNVGNAPLEGEMTLQDPPEGLTLTAPSLDVLAPGNATRVPVTLVAEQPLDQPITIQVLDGGQPAGNTTLTLTAAETPLTVRAVRAPAEAPTPGELFAVTTIVENQGPVPVRNLTVALRDSGTTLASTTLERLRPQTSVPVTIEWVPDQETDRSDMTVELDPEGRILQDRSDDVQALETQSATPLPAPLLLLLISLALPARMRSLWRLATGRERALLVGGLLLVLLLVPLLLVPTVSLERAPAAPGVPADAVDSDGDGVSDTAEVTRYGTLAYPSDENATDSDRDSLPDGWEVEHARFDALYRQWRPDPAQADAGDDPDDDGLSNLGEYRNATDPHDPDTDGDSFPDGWEVRSRLDPTRPDDPDADCDQDGLTNREELDRGTLGCVLDSDRDGIPDDAELAGDWSLDGQRYEFEPTDPTQLSTGGSGAPDGWLLFHGLDPHDDRHRTADPDEDQRSTYEEWVTTRERGLTAPTDWSEGLIPTNPDTDADGLPDGWEVRVGLDPLDPSDGDEDSDQDGLSNAREERAGTSPTNPDTDGDSLDDGEEIDGWTIELDGEPVQVASNPLIRDTDGDGLPDKAERDGTFEGREFPSTNPLSGDTDGDGLGDLEEITAFEPPQLLDPTDADTDGDGLLDGEEWELWTSLVQQARSDQAYANAVRGESRRSNPDLATVLHPTGDLDDDGLANILDPDSDDPGGLPASQTDGIEDGEEVFPPARSGHILPTSDPSLRDSDGDGLPDGWEVRYTRYDTSFGGWLLDPSNQDTDGDGVHDGDEDMESGCFPGTDTEGDGPHGDDWPGWNAALPNRLELEQGTDPLACDTDGDGLPDGWELAVQQRAQSAGLGLQLNPLNVDSDSDATPDGSETSPVPVPQVDAILYVDDPLCLDDGETRTGKATCLWRWAGDTPIEQLVGDLVNDGVVELRGTCATSKCAVVSRLNLTTEVVQRTDPAAADTDGDGFPDAWEVLHRFDPQNPASPQDPTQTDEDEGQESGDGLSLQEEFEQGTDPNSLDTDRGGLIDGVDIDPLDPRDDRGDCDFDGIDDAGEARGGITRAGDPDSDGDGLVDQVYTTDDCPTVDDGGTGPRIGIDILAVPGPVGGPEVLGETQHGTEPGRWDSDGDGLPDGWEVLHGTNPSSQDSPQADSDGDGLGLEAEYLLGRPAWWDEATHGAWWFGSDPTVASSRDLDGDGLDDALFDPEPLSPDNDCGLPGTWNPPPAWNDRERCLAEEPSDPAATRSLVLGLRQLAYAHVMDIDGSPEQRRGGQESTARTTVRATGLSVPQTLDTAQPFNVTVDLCADDGNQCTAPSSGRPLVGIYAVTRGQGAMPLPKSDPLLCVLRADASWTAQGQCHLDPRTHELPGGGTGLVLALHRHGVLEPGSSWQVLPGDITPGDALSLAAWPLPTETDAGLLVGSIEPVTVERTPVGQAVISLLDDPVLEAGQKGTIRLALTDEAGHTLDGRALQVTWNEQRSSTLTTGASGVATLSVDAVQTENATTIPLEARFRTAGVLEGTTETFQVPVRIGSQLNATAQTGTAPGSLAVDARLTDRNGQTLGNRTLAATARLPGLSSPVTTNATTDSEGRATLQVPLPGATNPGQAAVTVRFTGDEQAGPVTWEGLADVRVKPEVRLQAPNRTSLTDGVSVRVELLLPSGAPVTPAPGEALTLDVRLGEQRVTKELTSAPPPNGLPVSFTPGPNMPLGTAELTASLGQGRFNDGATATRPLVVTTPVSASVEPTVLGVGVDNEVTVQVRDALSRPIGGMEATLSVLNVTANGNVSAGGDAVLSLPLGLDAPRGEQLLRLELSATDRTLSLTDERRVTLRLGTHFEVPANLTGSVDRFQVQGRLLTATGEPVSESVVTVEALGTHEVVTGGDGRFLLEASPPDGVESGTYPIRFSYEGSQSLAPAQRTQDLLLLRPVNLTLDRVAHAVIGGQARVTGLVASGQDRVDGATVQLTLANQTYTARTGGDGRFTLSFPVGEGTPRTLEGAVVFPGQQAYAPARKPFTLQVVQPVELTASQRTTDDGLTLALQAATGDGQPLARRTVLAVLPGQVLQLETDQDGVARFHLDPSSVPEGTEVEFLFQGTDAEAAASTTLAVQSATTPVQGRPIALAVVALVVVVELIVLYRVLRRGRVLDRILDAVEDLEHSLLAGNEMRAAVLQAYRRIQAALSVVGFEEEAWQTHREYLTRTFEDLDRETPALETFLDLVDRAQYDRAPMTPEDRNRALERSRELIAVLQDTLPHRRSVAA